MLFPQISKTQYASNATHSIKLISLVNSPSAISLAFTIFAPWPDSFTFENMGASAHLSILDFVVLPFVIAIVYAIAYNIRNKKYPSRHPWRKYFIPALSVKIFGAVFIGLIYAYYYGGGDTYYFFNQSQVLN